MQWRGIYSVGIHGPSAFITPHSIVILTCYLCICVVFCVQLESAISSGKIGSTVQGRHDLLNQHGLFKLYIQILIQTKIIYKSK